MANTTGSTIASGVGIFMSAIGTIEKVDAAYAGVTDSRQVAERNARIANEAAADAIAKAGIPGSRARMQGSQIIGEQKAQLSASGVAVGVGSAARAADTTRYFSDLDEQIIRNNAALQAYGLRTQANLDILKGQQQAQAYENQATGAVIGGVAQVVSQAGHIIADMPSGKAEDTGKLYVNSILGVGSDTGGAFVGGVPPLVPGGGPDVSTSGIGAEYGTKITYRAEDFDNVVTGGPGASALPRGY